MHGGPDIDGAGDGAAGIERLAQVNAAAAGGAVAAAHADVIEHAVALVQRRSLLQIFRRLVHLRTCKVHRGRGN